MPNDVDKNEVVISVRGGCFEIDSIPDNLQVVVKDYDCLDTVGPLARKVLRDAFGDRYMQTVHEGGETPQMTERQKEIVRIAVRLMVKDLANIKAEAEMLNIEMGLACELEGGLFYTMEEEELIAIIDLLN